MFREIICLQVLFAIFLVAFANHSSDIVQNAVLMSNNKAHYFGNFTYTIENFLEISLSGNTDDDAFRSVPFPSKEDNGVQWQFRIYPRVTREDVEEVDVDLLLNKLPNDASSFIGRFECGIIDIKGNKQYLSHIEDNVTVDNGLFLNPFISRTALESEKNDLLPKGHLTLQCSVKGFINNQKMITHEVEQFIQQKIPTLECGKSLASDTMEHMNLNDYYLKPDVVLESSGKQFKRHKDILSARSPVLSDLFANVTTSPIYTFTVFNFTNEMNEMELEDMLTFLYKGAAPYLDLTCRNLYVVAKKFQLDCLVATCEEVFISKLNQENAWEFLLFAKKHYAARLKKNAATYISKYSEECL